MNQLSSNSEADVKVKIEEDDNNNFVSSNSPLDPDPADPEEKKFKFEKIIKHEEPSDDEAPPIQRKKKSTNSKGGDVCLFCDQIFTTITRLNIHMKCHTRPFKCDQCGHRSDSAHNLENHMKAIHSNLKPLKCPYKKCGHRTKTKVHLDLHIRHRHTGSRPYKCHLCPYSCHQSPDLVVHIRRHEGVKPFKCSFENCDYRSAHMGHVKRHEKIHKKPEKVKNEEEKVPGDFRCAICSHRTSDRYKMHRHLLNFYSSVKRISCAECGEKFKKKEQLYRHHRDYPSHKPPSEVPYLPRTPAWRSKTK